MDIRENKTGIIVTNIRDFDIKQVLECGQFFRFQKIADKNYIVVAKDRVIKVHQKEQQLIIDNTDAEEFTQIWMDYFDLNTDYSYIKQKLSKSDPILEKAIAFAPGIRILNQDVWEMVISFIISQNKALVHIKQCIQNICVRFGTKLSTEEVGEYYGFPTIEQLSKATEADLRECKVGFRAPYIIDACQKIKGGGVPLKLLKDMPTHEAKEHLLTIKGIGNKVADCILLFGLGKQDVFPTDVWVQRVMEELYFYETVKKDKIEEFSSIQFGNLAGYAQQYLFYYARENKIGKKDKKKDEIQRESENR